jgi:hypothetical protein
VLWANRFKGVLIERGEALAAVAAYIELNRFAPIFVPIPKTIVIAATQRRSPFWASQMLSPGKKSGGSIRCE